MLFYAAVLQILNANLKSTSNLVDSLHETFIIIFIYAIRRNCYV